MNKRNDRGVYDKNIWQKYYNTWDTIRKILIENRKIIIEFDDVYEKRRKIQFYDYQGIKITPFDNQDLSISFCKECCVDKTYVKCLLENTDLTWRQELQKNLESRCRYNNIVTGYNHFVLDLGDVILEIVAKGYEEITSSNN